MSRLGLSILGFAQTPKRSYMNPISKNDKEANTWLIFPTVFSPLEKVAKTKAFVASNN